MCLFADIVILGVLPDDASNFGESAYEMSPENGTLTVVLLRLYYPYNTRVRPLRNSKPAYSS
jgi:hypothetical protein